MATPETPPTLQPPGAGLPWWERLGAKYVVFPRACRKLTWDAATQLFLDEGAKVLAVWDALPPDHLTERVLIRRFPGIEDSSRYWSAAMTVEHLNIVGPSIRQIVASLRRGVVPDRVARTEDVKPRGELPPADVRATFDSVLAAVAAARPTDSPVPRDEGPRFAHPWFGPIDAFRWHCLLGIHQGLHRRQMEAVRDGLAGRKTVPVG